MAIIFSVLNHTVFHTLPRQIRGSLTPAVPLILFEDQEYLSCIDDVLVTSSYVYVLYGELHLVKVYDTDRNYVCTLIVADQNSNGTRAQIYVHEDTLYLLSANEIYEFADNAFVRFHSYQEDTSLRLSINQDRHSYRNHLDHHAYRYYIKHGSIYRSDWHGTESIFLQCSPMYFLCSPTFSWLLWAVFFVLLVFPARIHKRQRNTDLHPVEKENP